MLRDGKGLKMDSLCLLVMAGFLTNEDKMGMSAIAMSIFGVEDMPGFSFDYEELEDNILLLKLYLSDYFLSDLDKIVGTCKTASELIERVTDYYIAFQKARFNGELDAKRKKILDEGRIFDFLPQAVSESIINMKTDAKNYNVESASGLFSFYKNRFDKRVSECYEGLVGTSSSEAVEDGFLYYPNRFSLESIADKGFKMDEHGKLVLEKHAILKKI